MDGDHPVTRREDDRLGFSPIAEHLTCAILDQPAPQGFVFGIEGKWGSGKTTLINLTMAALRASGPQAPEIVSFSPWLVGDRDELLQTLFDELAIAAVKIDAVIDSEQSTRKLSIWRRLWGKKEGNAHWRLHVESDSEKGLDRYAGTESALAIQGRARARLADQHH
jgi:hypothetical protein